MLRHSQWRERLYAVIRVRGHSKIGHDAVRTLEQMRLHRVNHLVLVPETETFRRMLNVAKDYVTWGEVDSATVEALFSRTAARLAEERRQEVVGQLLAGRKPGDLGVDEVIRLHPPRGGWEAVKKPYSTGGSLGYRGSDIVRLIERMMPEGAHGKQDK